MVKSFCCEMMNYHLTTFFTDPESVDCVILYVPKFDEYGMPIHDGGSSYVLISFCPWCGKELPESKRDRWFNELKKIGIHDPMTEDIPEKYRSDRWYME